VPAAVGGAWQSPSDAKGMEEHAMHRAGSLRVGWGALSLVAAVVLNREWAVADTELPLEAGGADAVGTAASAWVGDGGVESNDAARPEPLAGGPVENGGDDASAAPRPAPDDGALFGDPDWMYTPPTYDTCLVAPVAQYWVDGISPSEDTECGVD